MVITADTYGVAGLYDLETDELISYVVLADSDTGQVKRLQLAPDRLAGPLITEIRRFRVMTVEGTELCRTGGLTAYEALRLVCP